MELTLYEADFVFHRALLHTIWGRKKKKVPFTHKQTKSRRTEIYGVDTMKLICFSQGFATNDMGQKKKLPFTHTQILNQEGERFTELTL